MKAKVLSALILAVLLSLGAHAHWATSGTNIYNTNSGNVGIGTTSPTTKLQVINSGASTEVVSVKNNSSTVLSLYASANADFYHAGFFNYRSRGTYQSPTDLLSGDRVGAFSGQAYLGSAYRGIASMEIYVGSGASSSSFPGYILFKTVPSGSTTALERLRISESGNVGIGTSSPSYLLHVNGVVAATGYQTVSDQRFKTGIQRITGSLEKISNLNGYTYTFNASKYSGRNFPSGQQIGVLAQEVQKVLPGLVMEDDQGYLSVNYVGLIPLMLEAIKELKSDLDQIKREQFTRTLEQMEAINKSTTEGSNLAQNFPNPFTAVTRIRFEIPDGTLSAFIILHDLDGHEVRKIEVQERGNGALDLSSEQLSPGLFYYSLVLDGKLTETKKLMLSSK